MSKKDERTTCDYINFVEATQKGKELMSNKKTEIMGFYILFSINVGLRVSDIKKLTFADLREGTWKFKEQKTSKYIEVPFNENIKRAISKHKKVKNALGYINEIEQHHEEAVDLLLDEHHPLHALGITNAHHGDRTTDPFDTQREDLLFLCQNCNLKLSLSMLVTNLSAKKICFECAEKVASNE